jgi:hypothetical protein
MKQKNVQLLKKLMVIIVVVLFFTHIVFPDKKIEYMSQEDNPDEGDDEETGLFSILKKILPEGLYLQLKKMFKEEKQKTEKAEAGLKQESARSESLLGKLEQARSGINPLCHESCFTCLTADSLGTPFEPSERVNKCLSCHELPGETSTYIENEGGISGRCEYSPTNTATNSATNTATNSATNTATNSESNTATNSESNTATNTATNSEQFSCNENHYIFNSGAVNICLPCPPGTASNGDLQACSHVLCSENEYALNHVCTACPTDTSHIVGEDASGPGTPCV